MRGPGRLSPRSRRMVGLVAAFAAPLLFAIAPLAMSLPESHGAVDPRRLDNLARGVNLNGLFTTFASPRRFRVRLETVDFALIKRMGFTFCRLPLDAAHFFDPAHPDRLRPDIRSVDVAVRKILAAGLSVIIDPIHPSSSEPEFDEGLATNPRFAAKIIAYWEAIARRYAGFDPNRVFFEIMNEPHASAYGKVGPGWWPPIQERLARAIRAAAPDNTIIATGEEWGGIDGLVAIRPLPDPDVIYSFHFYQPLTFTHQGATWVGKARSELAQIPFPSSLADIRPALARLSDPRARRLLERYGRENWSGSTIRATIDRAVAWSRRWNVPLMCGEFGVYRKVAPPEARDRWIRDVRMALEKDGIGWAMWDYDEGFGIVSYAYPAVRSGRIIDDATLEALGLRPIHPSVEQSTIARFLDGTSHSLALPLSWLGPLWNRDPDGGRLSIASAAGPSSPTTRPAPPLPAPTPDPVALVDHTGPRDWAIGPRIVLAVHPGERLRLTAWGWIAGRGSSSLEAVGRTAGGTVVSWDLGAVSPRARRKWVALTAHIVVPAGVATIQPRWAGVGPAETWITGMEIRRR